MKKNHPSKKFIINHITGKDIRPDIENHITECSECGNIASVYKRLLAPGNKEMRPGKFDSMYNYIQNAAIDYLNNPEKKSETKSVFGKKRKYIVLSSILSASALILFFFFTIINQTGFKDILKVSYSKRGRIKSKFKEKAFFLPMTLSTKINDQYDISGILNTKFRFYGQGSLKLTKKDKKQYSINLVSGNLLINTGKFLSKNALEINASKTKFHIYGKQIWISTDKNESKVALISGRMRIKNLNNDFILKTGQGALIKGTKKFYVKKVKDYLKKDNYKTAQKFFNKKELVVKKIKPKQKQTKINKTKKILYKVLLINGLSIDGKIIYKDKKLVILKSRTGTHKIKRSAIRMIIHYKEFTD